MRAEVTQLLMREFEKFPGKALDGRGSEGTNGPTYALLTSYN